MLGVNVRICTPNAFFNPEKRHMLILQKKKRVNMVVQS